MEKEKPGKYIKQNIAGTVTLASKSIQRAPSNTPRTHRLNEYAWNICKNKSHIHSTNIYWKSIIYNHYSKPTNSSPFHSEQKLKSLQWFTKSSAKYNLQCCNDFFTFPFPVILAIFCYSSNMSNTLPLYGTYSLADPSVSNGLSPDICIAEESSFRLKTSGISALVQMSSWQLLSLSHYLQVSSKWDFSESYPRPISCLLGLLTLLSLSYFLSH